MIGPIYVLDLCVIFTFYTFVFFIFYQLLQARNLATVAMATARRTDIEIADAPWASKDGQLAP